jgi:HlyD family secretion protein
LAKEKHLNNQNMKRKLIANLISLTIILGHVFAEDQKPNPETGNNSKEPSEPTPSEHTAKTGPFHIKVELDAFFSAEKEHKISLSPEAWADMTLISALSHGTKVKKGQSILSLETKKLKKTIEEIEIGSPSAKLALKLLESELASLEKSTPLIIEKTQREKNIADENLSYYEKVGHPEAIRATELSLHFAMQGYDYAKEEYEQLLKMYEADDLTEETEEIILKRAKNSFERASENLRLSKMSINRQLKISLPQQLISKKSTAVIGEITFQDSMLVLPRTLEQKRHSVQKAKRDQAKAEENLKKLKTDLESFEIVSPANGTLYYGLSKDGKWITAPAIIKKLVPGGKLAPREVFMTIVEPGSLGLRAIVPEAKLTHLKNDLAATIIPTSNPSLKIKGKVINVNHIPGSFSVTLSAEIKDPLLFPGMTAKVTIIAAKYDKVITVPNALLNDSNVWIMNGEDKIQRPVKLGPSDGKVTVILEGLNDGEKVVSK